MCFNGQGREVTRIPPTLFLPQLLLILQSDWLIIYRCQVKSPDNAERVNVSRNAFLALKKKTKHFFTLLL